MSKPNKFRINTDFASHKNDDVQYIQFTIPASIVIPYSGTFSYSATHDLNIGVQGADSIVNIEHSFSPNKWFHGHVLWVELNGTRSGVGATTYLCYIYITKKTPTTMTVNVFIPNDSGIGGTLTTEGVVRTVTVAISTFLPPFD